MKHKRWQVVVMIAFAWVLWVKHIGPTDKTGNWDIEESFETKKECMVSVEKELEG